MLAEVSGKKLKRSKAKEELGSEGPTGSKDDVAETMPLPSLPADSQDPWEEFPDSQPAFSDSQPVDVGGGVEREDGEEGDENSEGAEEEKLTDDEVVEPVVCHENCEYNTDTSPPDGVDPPAPRGGDAGKDKVEAKDVTGSGGVAATAATTLLTAGSADVRATAPSGAGDVPENPPPSPSKDVMDLDSDDERPKNQSKDASENVKTKEALGKGTWKDGPSTDLPY